MPARINAVLSRLPFKAVVFRQVFCEESNKTEYPRNYLNEGRSNSRSYRRILPPCDGGNVGKVIHRVELYHWTITSTVRQDHAVFLSANPAIHPSITLLRKRTDVRILMVGMGFSLSFASWYTCRGLIRNIAATS
jgi:hypothetical protein